MGLFGNTESDYYHYSPLTYESAGGYTPYTSALKDNYGNTVNEMLSGKLTPEEQAMLTKEFAKNNAATKEGAYGMPLGAQKSMEAANASDFALKSFLAGLNKKQTGLQYGMPLINADIGQNEFGYNATATDVANKNNFNVGQARTQAEYDANAKNKAAESGLNLAQPLSNLMTAASSAITGGAGSVLKDIFGNATNRAFNNGEVKSKSAGKTTYWGG